MPFVLKQFDVKLNMCYKVYTLETIYPYCAYQNDVIKNFAVVMGATVKRVDSVS